MTIKEAVALGARPGLRLGRWTASAVALAVILAAGFLALPPLYVQLVLAVNAEARFDRIIDLHIFLNCCANMAVMLFAWRLTGRLDRRIAGLINVIVVSHGALALGIIATHAYYSNLVMVAAVAASGILGLGMIGLSPRLTQPRIAVVGPRDPVARRLGSHLEFVESPHSDLKRYDLLLTTFSGVLSPEWSEAINRAMLAGKPVRHAAEYLEEAQGVVSIEHFDVEHLPDGGLTSYRSGKRALDMLILIAFLPAALVLLALGIVAVLISMGRPVFYSQPRVGQSGRVFQIYKLRTMRAAKLSHGEIATAQGDARITPVGGLLRRLHIDEIPQLWCVAKGEMSFIGPRPEQPALTDAYVSAIPAFAYRQMVRPGITGWAQVRAGYAANLEETRIKLGYDLFYLKYFSFGLDAQILLRTAWTVLLGGGVR